MTLFVRYARQLVRARLLLAVPLVESVSEGVLESWMARELERLVLAVVQTVASELQWVRE